MRAFHFYVSEMTDPAHHSFISEQSISFGVDYIDGTVVGARMMSESPSSVFISSLHVKPPNGKTEDVRGQNRVFATSPPTFEISAGTYVNAAGEEYASSV
jgi:hypothetical protein